MQRCKSSALSFYLSLTQSNLYSYNKRVKIITISGGIGSDFMPSNLREALADTEDAQIELASPGGYISDGIEIRNIIRNHSGNVNIKMTGMVASIAAYISTAVPKENVSVNDDAYFMIHNAMGLMWGDYRDMESEAKELKRLNAHIGKAFASQTGKPVDEILSLMDEETWFYGQEIIDAGFAGSMVETGNKDSKENLFSVAKNSFNDFKASFKTRKDDIKRAASYINKKEPVIKTDPNIDNGEPMNKQELLEKANVFMANGELTLSEIAEATNQKDKLVTKEHVEALNLMSQVTNLAGEKPVEFINGLISDKQKNEASVRSAKMTESFGPAKFKDGKVNDLRTYAEMILKSDIITDERINEVKADPITKKLAGELADENSDANNVTGISVGKNTNDNTVAVKKM